MTADEPDHYQQVADIIEMTALEPACIDVTVVQDGRVLDHVPGMYVLARCLDKAGLIDHRALVEEPCDQCEHARDAHADSVQECSFPGCSCEEWWPAS